MSESSYSGGEPTTSETKYSNFAATSTINYMTIARNRYHAEVSSSGSATPEVRQSSYREGPDDTKKNGNGELPLNASKTDRLLRVRKVAIAKYKKQVACLENENVIFKKVLSQLRSNGTLTDLCIENLKVSCLHTLQCILFHLFRVYAFLILIFLYLLCLSVSCRFRYRNQQRS